VGARPDSRLQQEARHPDGVTTSMPLTGRAGRCQRVVQTRMHSFLNQSINARSPASADAHGFARTPSSHLFGPPKRR
jgi:hypothetical protein